MKNPLFYLYFLILPKTALIQLWVLRSNKIAPFPMQMVNAFALIILALRGSYVLLPLCLGFPIHP